MMEYLKSQKGNMKSCKATIIACRWIYYVVKTLEVFWELNVAHTFYIYNAIKNSLKSWFFPIHHIAINLDSDSRDKYYPLCIYASTDDEFSTTSHHLCYASLVFL